MVEALCSECIEDKFLRAVIEQEGFPDICGMCNEERSHTISLERLGEIVAAKIREHYEQGSDIPIFYGDTDKLHYEQEGEDIDSIIQEILGQYFEFNEEIVDAVISSEYCDPRDGDVPFFNRDTNYVEKPISSYDLVLSWAEAAQEIKEQRRFFSSSAKRLFEELFDQIDEVRTSGDRETADRGVVARIPKGTQLYRGRICDDDKEIALMLESPYQHVGPPPPHLAKAGRMNAEGIPVFYGAMDEDTCLAELRPALSQTAAIIKLETTKPLRILDFNRFRRAYKSLSYFQPDFNRQASRIAFIRQLAKLISRPIVPGHEREYLITQTLMEYLAHIHRPAFDGVFFESAQRAQGINVVLFEQDTNKKTVFPIKYVEKTVAIFKTTSIKYEHKVQNFASQNGNAILELEHWDDEDE